MPIRALVPVKEGDPLTTTRRLMVQVMAGASLDGLFAVAWVPGSPCPSPSLMRTPEAVEDADPFATVMVGNAASGAIRLLRENPDQRVGVFVRPCELRSLKALATKHEVSLNLTLLMSADCLATFPEEDFRWRVAEAADRDRPTRDALRFAAQGGILPGRLRSSCQMCDQPYSIGVDLHIEMLGLETSKYLVVEIRDEELARQIGLDKPSNAVPPDITARRLRVLQRLADWRQRSRAYAETHLLASTASPDGLLEHLAACDACRSQLVTHCPMFEEMPHRVPEDTAGLRDWLSSCGGCGLCEHSCPSGYPLALVVAHLKHTLGA